jgi:hypothetical protein
MSTEKKSDWYKLTHYFSERKKFLEEIKKESLQENPENIIEEEKKHLQLNEKETLSGLAISGGGIRSASFGLGVMQALAENEQLSKIHYMSTVSGGGYIGSALTWALHQDNTADTSSQNFPFKRKEKAESGENTLLNYIRQHGNYLAPTSSLDIVSFAAIVIRGMLMSVFVYFSLLTAFIMFVLAVFYLINTSLSRLIVTTDLVTSIEIVVLLIILGFVILKRFFNQKSKYRLLIESLPFALMLINFIFLALLLFHPSVNTLLITAGIAVIGYFMLKGFIDSVGIFSLLNEVYTVYLILIGIILYFTGSETFVEYSIGTVFILLVVFILKRIFSSKNKDKQKEKDLAHKKYDLFIKGQKRIGLLLKIGIACIMFGLLPYISKKISFPFSSSLLKTFFDNSSVLMAIVFTLFGVFIGIWQYNKIQKKEKTRSKSSGILIYAGVFALVFGVLFLSYTLADKLFELFKKDTIIEDPLPPDFYLLFLLIVAFIYLVMRIGRLVDLNLVGPHQLWRNRLMETFMPDEEAVKQNKWMPAKKANSAQMEDMCFVETSKEDPTKVLKKPYHIINANIILSNSTRSVFRSRGGDNFIISPLYCGSSATQWVKTNSYQKAKQFINSKLFNAFHERQQGITLATAMAVSAAALNANAGVSGKGVSRNSIVSILLSLLNLRLGYWTSNPNWPNPLAFNANLTTPGLMSEVLKKGFTESDQYVLLSDGGHFENLGLYELIRRKLDLIIVSDGGADPDFNFDDLANAIEKVRVDFNAKIEFIDGYKTDDILPGTAGTSFFHQKHNIAKKGFGLAKITYNNDDKPTAILVYLKLAMIDDLPTDLYSYKGVNPAFPHESTADQSFDEKQFEAYRELGYHVAWQMMRSAEYENGQDIFPLSKDLIPPTSLQIGNMSMRINGKLVKNNRKTNTPDEIKDIGIEVADWLTDLYRDFHDKHLYPFVKPETDPQIADGFPPSGNIEVEINETIYKFTFESKDYPDTPETKDFYVKLDPTEENIWHSSTAHIKKKKKDKDNRPPR